MKKTIFVDFDDSIVFTRSVVVAFLNHQYQIGLSEDEFHCGNNLDEVVNQHLPEEKRVERFPFYIHYAEHFLASLEWHEEVTPTEGACEALATLSKSFDIWVVTARQSKGAHVVRHLIDRFFKGQIRGVHYVWKNLPNDKLEECPKRKFIEEFEGEKVAFVDDNPGEVLGVHDILPSFLFDPHDHHADFEYGCVRTNSWEEIVSAIL